jgi:hypothetical protein
MTVRYAPGSGSQVHAEFKAFMDAHPDEAADGLAILHHVAVAGLGGLDGEQRDGFGLARPFCHQAAEWGIFFEVGGPWNGPCMVTLLLIADLAHSPIESAKRQAILRWVQATGVV